MRLRLLLAAALALALQLEVHAVRADVKLPQLVSDGMVLQEKAPVRVWGWASEGEEVRVTFRGRSVTTASRGGKWSVTLNPMEPGAPSAMTIAGSNTIVVNDVVVGEVWVCSGQSNMEFPLTGALDAKKEIASPADPLLRMFTVGKKVADSPQADVSRGRWEAAAPQTRGHFSAVGYFFGRALRRARGVPVGLIHASWGGTPAEAWTSRAALEGWGMPTSSFRSSVAPSTVSLEDYKHRLAAWEAAGSPAGQFEDPGVAELAKSWALPQADVAGWGSMSLPQPWEKAGADMEIDSHGVIGAVIGTYTGPGAVGVAYHPIG